MSADQVLCSVVEAGYQNGSLLLFVQLIVMIHLWLQPSADHERGDFKPQHSLLIASVQINSFIHIHCILETNLKTHIRLNLYHSRESEQEPVVTSELSLNNLFQ